MNTEIFNYLELMKDSLVKKGKILATILELTKEQEKLLGSEYFDDEAFSLKTEEFKEKFKVEN